MYLRNRRDFIIYIVIIVLFCISQMLSMFLWFKAIFPPTFQYIITIPLFIIFCIKKKKIFILFASLLSLLISVPFDIFMLVMNNGIQSYEGVFLILSDVLCLITIVLSILYRSISNKTLEA